MLDSLRKILFPTRTPPRVPAGVAVYAIGDIHGRADLLTEIHQLIAADVAPDIDRRIVIYLGDYVDRGADSRAVIDELIESPLADFEAIHILGNHELMLLDYIAAPADGGLWLANGGDATLLSYGVEPAAGFDEDSRPNRVRDAFVAAMPDTHRSFLTGLRTHWAIGDYYFVHAGVRPGIPLDAQTDQDMLWIREPFRSSRRDHGKIVVHGHSRTTEPEVQRNRIGIDTGAYLSNHLTALALLGSDQRFLSTG